MEAPLSPKASDEQHHHRSRANEQLENHRDGARGEDVCSGGQITLKTSRNARMVCRVHYKIN
ncbi:hypothetical protein EJB05_28717, partial [Eragrostis curvula]